AAKRDGHPRQNPAYRPATGKPCICRVFLLIERSTVHHRCSTMRCVADGSGLGLEGSTYLGVSPMVGPKSSTKTKIAARTREPAKDRLRTRGARGLAMGRRLLDVVLEQPGELCRLSR